MKTVIMSLAIITTLMTANFKLYAQGGAANNQPTTGNNNFLGWHNSGSASDQEISVENCLHDQNIVFKTNDAATTGTGTTTTKMTIVGCSSCGNDGYVGIGVLSPAF